MKNKTCDIKLTDEDSIFELCEMPHRCADCTKILHKIKRVLTEDWFIENLNYSQSICIELESEIVPAMAPLFRIQGILDFMQTFEKTFSEEHRISFNKKSFLLENRVFRGENDNKLKLTLKIYFPPLTTNDIGYQEIQEQLLKYFPEYEIKATSYEPESFEPELFNPDLFEPGIIEDALADIETNSGAFENQHETIFLFTWGVFDFEFTNKEGFYCKLLDINKLNLKEMKIYVPE